MVYQSTEVGFLAGADLTMSLLREVGLVVV